jgi:PAS domain S-box-containing protein
MIELNEKYKIWVMVILLAIASFLTYYFIAVLKTAIVFTHFFYIPIILASLWWKRKGLIVVIFLAALLILNNVFFKMPSYENVFRIFMFMVIGCLVAVLSEKIAESDELVSERTNELRESEAKYRTLYESSSDAIMLLDEKGFLDCNNATLQMFGFLKKEDFIKVHLADVSPPYQPDGTDSLTAANKKVADTFRKGINFFEWVHRRKNGEDFPAEVLLTALQLKGKQVLQATLRDITERKRAMEALRLARDEAERASMVKTNFLNTMSHELRTPLNAILGFSELLKQKTIGELNEKQERYICNIQKGGNKMLNIVSQILDVVQMDKGTLDMRIENISVPETVDEVMNDIKENCVEKNVVLEKNIDPQLKHLEADKQKLKQVLIQLLENGVKFSKLDGGTVTVTAKKEGDMAKFSVSDIGIGIKEEDMLYIFQKFTQLDTGMNRRYGGTGIGLAMVKHIVELHGGKIWAESKFGEGSTFTFLLPLKAKKLEKT